MGKEELRFKIREAFGHDPEVGTSRISITLIENDILLEGEVDNLHAKARAGAIARSLASNCQVDNSLTVGVNRPPNDADLTRLAREALVRDPELPLGMGVKVDGGLALLTGTAPTMDAVMRASDLLSRIPGISGVHRHVALADQVTFDSIDTTYDIDDQSIVDAIALRLANLATPLDDRVTVRANNGIAHLTGQVLSGGDRLEAEREAFKVAGVHAVHNDLIALDGTTGGDEALEAEIRSLLGKARDDATTGYIGVMVKDGTAFLFGVSDWPEGAEEAGKLAAKVKGIRNVINDIKPMDRRKA